MNDKSAAVSPSGARSRSPVPAARSPVAWNRSRSRSVSVHLSVLKIIKHLLALCWYLNSFDYNK